MPFLVVLRIMIGQILVGAERRDRFSQFLVAMGHLIGQILVEFLVAIDTSIASHGVDLLD